MFEPLTRTVSQLAIRWGYSVHDVLTRAIQENWAVYFQFDGLVFDVNDTSNRCMGNWRRHEEAAQMEKEIEQAEGTLIRNLLCAQGKLKLTEWEDILTQDGMCELRQEIDLKKTMLAVLSRATERWNEERQRYQRNGNIRAAPITLQSIAERGSVSFPIKAFHPDSEVTFVREPGRENLIAVGRMVALEEMRYPKETMTADDLFLTMVDIKAIEADFEPASVVAQAERTASLPATAIEAQPIAAANKPWILENPKRYQGYRKPVYDVLKAAHVAETAMPSARDVLDALKLKKPPEIIEVLLDGIKYYGANGDTKAADLRDIQKTIDRLARYRPDSPAMVTTRPTS